MADGNDQPPSNSAPIKIGFSFGKVAAPPPRRVEVQPKDQERDYVSEFRDGRLVRFVLFFPIFLNRRNGSLIIVLRFPQLHAETQERSPHNPSQ